jgi:hypothetical protein
VLPLSELLAVRRCAEPSLPEGAGIWISTQNMPTVSVDIGGGAGLSLEFVCTADGLNTAAPHADWSRYPLCVSTLRSPHGRVSSLHAARHMVQLCVAASYGGGCLDVYKHCIILGV